MKKNNWWFIVLGVVIAVMIGPGINTLIKRYKLYKNKINSMVIGSGQLSKGNSMDFYLQNNLKITAHAKNGIDSLKEDDINIDIGDSISKEKNSWQFTVFKKNQAGNYQFYKSYDYSEYQQ